MALICPCGSAETSTGLGDTITCFTCGRHGDHAHAGRPNLHADSFPELDGDADDTAGEVTVEAEPA